MNVEVSRLPESRVTLKIELSPDEVDGALDRTYKQLVHRVNIPGFRKGKAPRPVVERMIGTEAFLHEATVAVKPEVELPDYHTIRVERPAVEVTDDEVDSLMDEIRERNATLEPVSRPAQIGDVVTMNVVAKVGGEEVINEENADFPLREEDEDSESVFP